MGISIPTKGLMAVQASDGDGRFTTILHTILRAGPRWESSRALMAGASAVVTALAVTGVVALSTGSAGSAVKDTAATTSPAKPHYLLPIAALVQDGTVPPPTLSGDTGTVGVPSGTPTRPTTPQTTNPNNSTISTYQGAPGTMTPAGIATLAMQRGCSSTQASIATAVAMAESGGSPSAQGDVSLMDATWDWSAGLWQIRGLRSERGTGALRDSIANQQAVTNSAAMYVISSGCTNWSPWTTYTRGLYLGYLGVARQAVNYVVAYFQAHGKYPAVAAPDPTAVIPVASGFGTGGEGALPASAKSGTASPAKPTSTKAKTAAKTSTPAKSSTSASRSQGGGSGSSATQPGPATVPTTPAKAPVPTTLPTKLPTTLPVKVPTTLPVPLPTVTLPGLPGLP